MAVTYDSIIEFTRDNKHQIIDGMKVKLASEFMARLNTQAMDDGQELKDLRIEERALSRVDELLETVLERMESGGK